ELRGAPPGGVRIRRGGARADRRRRPRLRRRVRRAGAGLADAGSGPRPRGRLRRTRAREEGRLMAELTYLEAISDGLRTEMRRDESVFCLGEDIGAFGGAFKETDGFAAGFGSAGVLDTPLAESAI